MTVLPPELETLSERLLPIDLDEPELDRRFRRAAVLVLLYPDAAGMLFPLTVRPVTLTRHAGQIALPGGLIEPGDRSSWEAALRETREELGISTSAVVPVGRLSTHHLTVSDYHIAPFVGWLEARPVMRPDPVEVAEVFEAEVEELLDPATVASEEWRLRGRTWSVTFYRFGGHVVWGATARMLYELACRLGDRPPHEGAVPGSVLPVN